MVIAILDDGICHDEINSPVETFCIRKELKKNKFVQKDHFSHATICAKIIEKYCNPEKILDIVFLDEDRKGNISDLCTALNMCIDKNVDVINLSNGIERFDINSGEYKELYELCKKIYYKNIIIYAAQSNSGRVTIPADFPYVKSVEQYDITMNRLLSLYRRSDIYTKGYHSIIIKGERLKVESSNSYACAYAVSNHNKKNIAYFLRGNLITSNFSYFKFQKIKKEGTSHCYDVRLDNNNIYGKIYSNNISLMEKRMLLKRNIKYWSYEIDLKLKKLIQNSSLFIQDDEIPIILVYDNRSALSLSKKLCASFSSKGYNPIITTTCTKYIVNGTVIIPYSCINGYSRVLSLYNCNDIMIVIAKNDDFMDDEDLRIQFVENNLRIFSKLVDVKLKDIEKLMEFVINYYK